MATKKIELVARALCALEGKDPDATVRTGNLIPVHDNGTVTMAPEGAPAWRSFVREAERFVAAYEVLSGD